MAGASTLDPDNFPREGRKPLKGHEETTLGTGENSDSGSDIAGRPMPKVEDDPSNRDRDVDRIVGPADAGLGGGLDQAEEARLGKTDEDIEREARRAGTRAKTAPRKP